MTDRSGSALNRIAAAGLLVGAGFGLAGTLVGSPRLQATLWAIDSVGLVIAASVLTVKFLRTGPELLGRGVPGLCHR